MGSRLIHRLEHRKFEPLNNTEDGPIVLSVRVRVFGVLALCCSAACLVDPDDRCGDTRVLSELRVCVCPDGTQEEPAGTACLSLTPDAGAPKEDAGLADSGAPTGVGASCTSPADCAAFDATYCDTLVTQTCMIEHCTVSPDDCPSGSECCDLSSFGLNNTLCVPAGECPTR